MFAENEQDDTGGNREQKASRGYKQASLIPLSEPHSCERQICGKKIYADDSQGQTRNVILFHLIFLSAANRGAGQSQRRERQDQPPLTMRGTELWNSTQRYAGQSIPSLTERVSGLYVVSLVMLLVLL